MASDRKSVSFKARQRLRDDIADYQHRKNYDHTADAARELVQIGLREVNGPILYRAKNQIIHTVTHLSILAVVIAIIGFMTTFIHAGAALEIAFVLVTIAVAMLAFIELAQRVTATPRHLRRVWGGES